MGIGPAIYGLRALYVINFFKAWWAFLSTEFRTTITFRGQSWWIKNFKIYWIVMEKFNFYHAFEPVQPKRNLLDQFSILRLVCIFYKVIISVYDRKPKSSINIFSKIIQKKWMWRPQSEFRRWWEKEGPSLNKLSKDIFVKNPDLASLRGTGAIIRSWYKKDAALIKCPRLRKIQAQVQKEILKINNSVIS